MKIKAASLVLVIAIIGMLLIPLTGVDLGFSRAAAESDIVKAFEAQNVLEDLQSSKVDGKNFDLTDYPYDSSGTLQLLNFVEFCYGYNEELRKDYGLYLYLYNPANLILDEKSKSNNMQIGVSYDKEKMPNDFVKFDLKFINKSDGDYAGLFYKFKVDLPNEFIDRLNSNGRRYDVSSIELATVGAQNAIDYKVGGTYVFTGYAAGYGPDAEAESTLKSVSFVLETIELDVKHTHYRTETSSKGAGYQNQVNTVYFEVPQKYFDAYGNLQRIKAEWYEYKTNDIIVTSNTSFYNAALPYLSAVIPNHYTGGELTGSVYNSNVGYSLGQEVSYGGGVLPNAASWGWNLGNGYWHTPEQSIYYLFPATNISSYDPYGDVVDIGGVQSNKLYQYILNYNKSFSKGTLPIKSGNISADLFKSDIDNYRKIDNSFGKVQQGYSYYDFDADLDLHFLNSWESTNPGFWDNWKNFGFWATLFGSIPAEESRMLSPIQILQNSDFVGDTGIVSDNLLINYHDVSKIQTDYYNAAENDKQLVLFRFATTDYYSAPVDIVQLGAGTLGSDKLTKDQAYRAWGSVFFDFDIIQLTFQKENKEIVIPAVSSPIDIIPSITPPTDFSPDWLNDLKESATALIRMIITIIVIVLLFAILWPVLPYIIKAIVWVVMLPFRLIGALIKAISNGIKRRRG